jgi:hypothetical protein
MLAPAAQRNRAIARPPVPSWIPLKNASLETMLWQIQ